MPPSTTEQGNYITDSAVLKREENNRENRTSRGRETNVSVSQPYCARSQSRSMITSTSQENQGYQVDLVGAQTRIDETGESMGNPEAQPRPGAAEHAMAL